MELATSYIFELSANGFASPDLAVNALLVGPDGTVGTDADNGSLGTRPGITAAEDIPAGVRLTIGAGTGVSANGTAPEYIAIVMDDDPTGPDEDGNPLTDANSRVIVRATGYAQDNSEVTLEAVISETELGALLVDGDVNITGSVRSPATRHMSMPMAIWTSAAARTSRGRYRLRARIRAANPARRAGTVDVPPVVPSDFKHQAISSSLTTDG